MISLLAGISALRANVSTPVHTTAKAPNGFSDQITYLASGNLTATPQRDGAGRINGYVWSDGTNTVTQTWTRGPGGRIESAGSDVTGAPSFTYLLDPGNLEESFDGPGRRLKCTTAGGTWTYVYGAGGQLTSATHPMLGTFAYAFDGIGRRTDKGTANTTDILNRTTSWTHSQNKTLTVKAAPAARVWFNGVEIENFNGTHSAAITPPGAEGGWVPWETLAILEGAGDGAGNPPANPLASPDAKAEKKGAVWVPPTAETLTYDAAGNRESSAQWDFGWDAKNQLARARTKNHTTAAQAYDITYAYDSEGRRVKKHVIEYQSGTVVSEKIITFVWDGWNLLYERHQLPSGLTLLERKYLWGPDIADGSAGGAGGLLLIRETKGTATTEIIPLYDGGGNVIALSDINKNLLASYQFGPFGEKISATGPNANSNPWRWATKYLDEETGLYYFGKRYYDPITGQWISREILGESESINLYQYAGNDPINFVDVLGLAKVATDGRGNLTTFGKALLAIAKDAPEEAKAMLMAAQVQREETGANIGGLIGNGDGSAIGNVLRAIDTVVGNARTDGRNEWQRIAAETGVSRDFDDGDTTQQAWTTALFADYAPAITASAANATAFNDAQRASSAKDTARQNSPGYRLKEIATGTADLPMHAGAALFSGLMASDVTTGAAITWNGWGNGFGLLEVSPGERAFAAAMVFLPLGRAEGMVDDVARVGFRAGSKEGGYMVSFMGKNGIHYYDHAAATLGAAGGSVWMAPLEDVAGIVNRAGVVTKTGHAPGPLMSFLKGDEIYGIAVPGKNLLFKLPSLTDSGANKHFRLGGITGVEHNGAWKSSNVRELITPGGNPVPTGSVFFKFNTDGSWTPIRKY
jgi:RHS repeat-associated protein